MLRVAICAVDRTGSFGSVEHRHHRTGAAAGGSFTLENITCRRSRAWFSYVLFVATQDDLICAQATGALTRGRVHVHAWIDHVRRAAGALDLGVTVAVVSRVRLKAKHLDSRRDHRRARR